MLHSLKKYFVEALRFASDGGIGARTSVRTRIETPARLRGAPPDLRTADPTVADEFAAGFYCFAGKQAQANGRSPFSLTPPSRAWRRSLAEFSWLRDLRAAGTPAGAPNRPHARPGLSRAALRPRRTTRRSSPKPPRGASSIFWPIRPFCWRRPSPPSPACSCKASPIRREASPPCSASKRAKGVDRLLCALGLFEFSLCTDASPQLMTQSRRAFLATLDEQILADGGHVSRNPKTTLDLALDFLALRQLMVAQGVKPPAALTTSIDKMISLLRLLQQGDGALARFNGMGAGNPGALATVFAHEPAGAPRLEDARASGYARMERGATTVIMDTGAPPRRNIPARPMPARSPSSCRSGPSSSSSTAGRRPPRSRRRGKPRARPRRIRRSVSTANPRAASRRSRRNPTPA